MDYIYLAARADEDEVDAHACIIRILRSTIKGSKQLKTIHDVVRHPTV